MQTYQARRSAEGLHGGVPDWLLKEQQHQQQQQTAPLQQSQLPAAQSVPPGRLSPDVRRNYYTSTRQQHRDYHQQEAGSTSTATNHNLRTRLPNHRIPPSEPIYLDIDPSIYQPMTVDHSDFQSPSPGTTTSTLDSGSNKSPSRFRSLNCNIGRPPTPPAKNHKGNTADHGNKYPFVRSYESPVAKEYRVEGGTFQNSTPQSSGLNKNNSNSTPQTSLYDTTPIADQDNVNESFDNMIMFGDDYDLGSITTGMSQQELLQKRRDVKKRRDGKYGKKKKSKERAIINMPPSLLSSKSWDTSPITKFVGVSSNHNNNSSRSNAQQSSSKDIGSRSPKRGQWNLLRALSPTQDEQGDTDATTLESGEHSPNPASPEQDGPRAPTPSDNHSIGSSSFPLLSSTARRGFIEDSHHDPLPHQIYSSAGNAYRQQASLQHRQVPQSFSQAGYYHHHQQQQHHQPRPQHMDIHQRQHGEELQRLEDHLQYLQEQHQQLEQEIHVRQRMQQEDNTSSSDYRRRAVRFASQLAQDMEEQGPSDEEGNTKVSPRSVSEQLDTQEPNKEDTSVLEPKVLFGSSAGKPKSILRRRQSGDLDANGRYSGVHRGRVAGAPRFYDTNGREVSPIRSPGRPNNTPQQTPMYQVAPLQSHEDLNSIPENPDDKDIAVLFDSETDIDIELMRREFDEDSGVMSEAFIEAVAAIVLQTAIRRFLAIRRVLKMKGLDECQKPEDNQNLSPSPTQTDGSLSQGAVAPEHKLEVESQTQSRGTSTRTVASGEQPDGQLMDQEDFFYDLAAIQIQCVFRGWWVRDSMNVDHYCTTLIQKVFRGFRARMEYEYDLYRVTMVQALWRRKKALRRLRGLLYLTVKVQANCRGFLARQSTNRLSGFPVEQASHYGETALAREHSERAQNNARKQAVDKARMERRRQIQQEKRRAKAAESQHPYTEEESNIAQICSIIIQTYWRSYFARMCYLQDIADIMIMQSVVRRWLAKRHLNAKMQSSPSQSGSTIAEDRIMANGMENPRQSQTVSSRIGARFQKFEGFESRHALSVGHYESTGSSSRKTHNSVDDTVPSVPFKMLPEDDPDQPPSLTPPREAKQAQTAKCSPSHFDNVNRFGGPRAGLDASGASPQHAVAPNSSFERVLTEKQDTMPASNWSGGRNTVGNNHGNNFYEQRSKWGEKHCDSGITATIHYPGSQNSQENDFHKRKGEGCGNLSQPSAAAKEKISRTKGWNVEEEIEKEATRNLIMAWKQKDKANTFTIKPRSED